MRVLRMQSRAAVGRWRGPPLWDHPQPSGRPRFGRSPPDDRGVPVRPAVDALYSDPEITALLRRYRIPRRHRPGGITDRFPTPARITPGFLRAAYLDIGLAPGTSSNSLTGHPAEQVLDLLHQHRKHRIPVRRAGGHSPGTAGNTTTHDDPPQTTPSHRSQGSTASGCRRRARTARPRPAAGRRRAPGWRPMRAPAPGGGFPPG